MRRVSVFCGSSSGTDEVYYKQAFSLGQQLAQRNIGLVYGGAQIGLMGAVADGCLFSNGEVIGVLPSFLGSKEIAHPNLSELIMVETMHQRKTKMNELCDGVIALPGGFGTLEEFFEILTWGQLGLHQKPMGLYNINGFYDALMTLMQSMVEKGFLKKVNYDMVLVSNDVGDLLAKMENYHPPFIGKWITEERT